ncbi:MAG: hypothetical protein ACUVT7_04220 [Thermoplasmata archaeon]
MRPKQAWGAFSLVVLFAIIALSAVFVDLGYDAYPVSLFALVAVVVYAYVLYKRYHVEVVPESDVALFDDIDDLRILCRIYGLDETGNTEALRQRLVEFARSNKKRAFAWVAPKAVLGLGSALEVSAGPQERETPTPSLAQRMISQQSAEVLMSKGLLGGRTRSSARLASISDCPVCGAAPPKSGTICSECGADLEFYAVLSESKVGKRLLSRKAGVVRRKLRYEVPSLGETR